MACASSEAQPAPLQEGSRLRGQAIQYCGHSFLFVEHRVAGTVVIRIGYNGEVVLTYAGGLTIRFAGCFLLRTGTAMSLALATR